MVDFAEIDHRGFGLSLCDIRTLRAMYRKLNPDITTVSLNKLPRKFLSDKILIGEFTSATMANYQRHCDLMEKYECEFGRPSNTNINTNHYVESENEW